MVKLTTEEGQFVKKVSPLRDHVAEQEQRQQTGVAELPGYQFMSPTPPAMKEVGLMGESFQIYTESCVGTSKM